MKVLHTWNKVRYINVLRTWNKVRNIKVLRTWRFMMSVVAVLLSSPPLSTLWTESSIEEMPSWPGVDFSTWHNFCNSSLISASLKKNFYSESIFILHTNYNISVMMLLLFSSTRLPKSDPGRVQSKLLQSNLFVILIILKTNLHILTLNMQECKILACSRDIYAY